MNTLLSAVAARMAQPSTWVGLGSLVTAVGWNIRPDLWEPISAVAMGVGGLLGVVLNEKKPEQK